MSWRPLSVVALAAGIALGGVHGAVRHAPDVFAGYTVLAADLHVHSWPDGIPPWDIVREARRRRLDVIALTSHNSMLGWQMWTRARHSESDVLVLPGEELTSVGYHLAIVGLTDTISWRQDAGTAARAAHAQGAVAILAHPTGEQLGRFVTDEDLRAVDGVEVTDLERNASRAARRRYVDVYARARSLAQVAAVGSSDFHYYAPLGVIRTYLFVRTVSADGVLEAIRTSRTVGCDSWGHVIGPAELARAVAQACAAEVDARPDGDTASSRLGTAIAWMTLLALVLFGLPQPLE